ncbi:MAG: DUF1858 domain-containing protein [bacterium]
MVEEHPITREMTISEVIKQFPSTEAVFIQYGLHCVGCEVASLESIAEGATTHNVKDVAKLLQDLNKATVR